MPRYILRLSKFTGSAQLESELDSSQVRGWGWGWHLEYVVVNFHIHQTIGSHKAARTPMDAAEL